MTVSTVTISDNFITLQFYYSCALSCMWANITQRAFLPVTHKGLKLMFNVGGGSECHRVIETKQLALGGLQTVALPVPTGFVSKNGECWHKQARWAG